MANHENLVRALVRAACAANPTAPVAGLTAVISGHYVATATQGGTLINCNEAGGNISFQVPSGFAADDIMALCEEAIQFIQGFADGTDVNVMLKTQRVKRLHVSFAKRNLAQPGLGNSYFGSNL